MLLYIDTWVYQNGTTQGRNEMKGMVLEVYSDLISGGKKGSERKRLEK